MEMLLDSSQPKATPHVERRVARDGLHLAVEHFGDPAAAPLIFAHGFGQNRHAWRASAESLAVAGWRGLALDGRGHGDSDWAEDGHYEMEHFVDDLIEVTRAEVRPPVLIGASMGGLLGLLAQGEANAPLFRALVLVDVTPRWESQGVERILDFMAKHPEGYASLDDAADAIARYLPHRERKDPQRLTTQLRRHADGRWRWHWDPRLLARVARDAERYIPRLLAAAARVDIPLLLLSGGRSDVVSSHTIDEFLRLAPHARHVRIEDATHMVVGDRNEAFTQAIREYLESL